jgi:hypothetical protein
MNRHTRDDNLADLDGLIEEIVVDTYDENEQLSAFQQAFEDEVPMPADAFVIADIQNGQTWEECQDA